MLSEEELNNVARELSEASRTRTPIDPVSETFPGLDLASAYEIQLINVRRRQNEGAHIRGHKVGLTAKAMQQMLGVNEPDYGHLLSDMFYKSGDSISIEKYCAPKIEVEVAFVIHSDLMGPNCTAFDVIRATEFVLPVFELIDSRIRDWKIRLVDTIADNASSAGVVLGDPPRSPLDLDLRAMGALLVRNGEIVETGAGGAVLGNPANAVAWLANKLSETDQNLSAGSIILPGSCTRAIDVVAGDSVQAHFDHLGSVSVNFY